MLKRGAKGSMNHYSTAASDAATTYYWDRESNFLSFLSYKREVTACTDRTTDLSSKYEFCQIRQMKVVKFFRVSNPFGNVLEDGISFLKSYKKVLHLQGGRIHSDFYNHYNLWCTVEPCSYAQDWDVAYCSRKFCKVHSWLFIFSRFGYN